MTKKIKLITQDLKGLVKKHQNIHNFDNIEYPIFCFRYLHKNFDLSNCTNDDKKALIERICKLSQMSWLEIQMADRHGLGSEKIKQSALKTTIPKHISKDIDFLALRFNGLKPIVGYKNGFIFHICFIDSKFTLYNH